MDGDGVHCVCVPVDGPRALLPRVLHELRAAGLPTSTKRVAHAVAESFFATLEFELLMKNDWHTRDEARRAIFRYIEIWYNRKRRHSTLGARSDMSAAYEEQVSAAA